MTPQVDSDQQAQLKSILDHLQSNYATDVSDWDVAALDDTPAVDSADRQDVAPQAPFSEKIMMVDDEPINIKVVRKYLREAGYSNFAETSDASRALELIRRERPQLLLLDIVMPDVDGTEILELMHESPSLSEIPVVVLTSLSDRNVKMRALELGVSDFLTKPVEAAELVVRVRNTLDAKAFQDHLKTYAEDLEEKVRLRTSQLAASQLEVIHCLGRAAEYRDNQTGRHVVRVGKYAGVIARAMKLPPQMIELIEQAAPLHDVGKIGIPDGILLKPGKLDAEEFEIMQKHCGFGKKVFEPMPMSERLRVLQHTSIGAIMLESCGSPIIRTAAIIALTHHEKWDGSGYPLGLSGEDIPLEGRVTAVADVFDALSTKRPYKAPMPIEQCFSILRESRGSHFDPQVVDAFFTRRDEILRIQIEFADVD